jgi:hypothetical protein
MYVSSSITNKIYKLPIYKVCLLSVFAHHRQKLKLYKGFVDVVDVEMNIWVGRLIEDVKKFAMDYGWNSIHEEPLF